MSLKFRCILLRVWACVCFGIYLHSSLRFVVCLLLIYLVVSECETNMEVSLFDAHFVFVCQAEICKSTEFA